MPVKILMVCLGNICRSPLAEALLQSKLPEDRFKVDSAGTGEWHVGKQPDGRSIQVAKKNGLDITGQRCRQFSASDFDEFDYIYVMDNSNFKDVIALARNEDEKQKVSMILEPLFPGERVDVPDPYFGLENGFDSVYTMLDEACQTIAKDLLERY
jgi:protein-tyrosine phosphatase